MPSERRLHPVSLLFNLGSVLGQLFFPAIVFLFAARSADSAVNLVALAVMSVLAAAVAIGRYLTFRYRYEATELIVRSGLLFRTVRHIPYERIHNLDARQNLFHRMLGVVEVRVETGAGAEPEATLSVLPRDALDEMRRRVFGLLAENAVATSAGPAGRGTSLLELSPGELLLAGFVENRGMVLIAAAYGVLWETGALENLLERTVGNTAWSESVARRVQTSLGSGGGLPLDGILLGLAALAGLLVFVRLLSMLWAVIRLYGFELTRDGDDLRADYGLFTRVVASIPLRRVQTLTVRENVLHRLFGRAAVGVATAGGAGAAARTRRPREWLAPVIRKPRVPGLVGEVLPELPLDQVAWQPAAPGAFWRAFRRRLAVSGLIGLAVLLLVRAWWALAVPLALGAWALVAARLHVKHLGWAMTGTAVLFRRGWLSRSLTVARLGKIQAVELEESPFDRRTGMASLLVDTAGATEAHRIRIPYLGRETAGTLLRGLAAEAAGRAFEW